MLDSKLDPTVQTAYERLGILELLKDKDIVEIMIQDDDFILYENKTGIHRIKSETKITQSEIEMLATALINIMKLKGKKLNVENPFLSVTLTGGERAHFVIPPATEKHASLTIRIPSKVEIPMDMYKDQGFFSEIKIIDDAISEEDKHLLELIDNKEYQSFLEFAIKYEKNIVVSGATGSGKTTFMKTLVNLIPNEHRIITIEDARELFIPQENQVNLLFSKNQESNITAKHCLESCLRMRPDNIILGEVRGDEAFYFVRACGNGHNGSITSLHADNPLMAIEQLALMIKASKDASGLDYQTIKKLILMNIDISIHLSKTKTGRAITGIYFDPAKKLKALKGD